MTNNVLVLMVLVIITLSMMAAQGWTIKTLPPNDEDPVLFQLTVKKYQP